MELFTILVDGTPIAVFGDYNDAVLFVEKKADKHDDVTLDVFNVELNKIEYTIYPK